MVGVQAEEDIEEGMLPISHNQIFDVHRSFVNDVVVNILFLVDVCMYVASEAPISRAKSFTGGIYERDSQ